MVGKTRFTIVFLLTIATLEIRIIASTLFEGVTDFNFTEAVKANGYNSEQHTVVTEDGYILTMFRMLPTKTCLGKTRKTPVLIMHGVFLSADSWIVAGPKSGLGYLVTDLCFDVWLGNFRGNTYSRMHITLDPDKELDFWKFSYTELGRYDIPAMIDYILEKTGSDKLNSIGFSQGASSFYVMCSERSFYCDKVNVTISLAPANRNINTASVIFRSVIEIASSFKELLYKFGVGEVFQKGSLTQIIPASLCPNFTRLCDMAKDVFSSINGIRPSFVTSRTIKDIYKTFPAGTSVQNTAHIQQLLHSDKFVKYDYGAKKNNELYGTFEAPSYNLSMVTMPVLIMFGLNDGLVSPKDVLWLVDQLPNVLELHPVANPFWNHEDNTYNIYVKDLLLPKIREYLLKYSY